MIYKDDYGIEIHDKFFVSGKSSLVPQCVPLCGRWCDPFSDGD